MTKLKNKKKGRLLEKRYEWLWELGVNKNCIITSPKFYKDNVTGELREIDVFIEVLDDDKVTIKETIMVECRNRNNVQDVTWVEQVVTKKNDLAIDKAIMVTSSFFTKPARIKAKYYGIEVERASAQTDEFIKEQQEKFKCEAKFVFMECNSIIIKTNNGIFDSSKIKIFPNLLAYLKKEISAFSASEFFVNELFEKVINNNNFFSNRKNNIVNVTYTFNPRRELDILQIFPYNNVVNNELGIINEISFSLDISPRFISFPLVNVITIFDDDQMDKLKTNKRHKSIYENDKIKVVFQIHNDIMYYLLTLKSPNMYWRFCQVDAEIYALLGNIDTDKFEFDFTNSPLELLGRIYFNI